MLKNQKKCFALNNIIIVRLSIYFIVGIYNNYKFPNFR